MFCRLWKLLLCLLNFGFFCCMGRTLPDIPLSPKTNLSDSEMNVAVKLTKNSQDIISQNEVLYVCKCFEQRNNNKCCFSIN